MTCAHILTRARVFLGMGAVLRSDVSARASDLRQSLNK